MKKLSLKIGYLYGRLMNTYGDTGNVVCLQKRCLWRGIEVEIIDIDLGSKAKKIESDLYFFGGGQDQAQSLVSEDLLRKFDGGFLKNEVFKGKPLLAICGGYQLLGEYYQPQKGHRLPGLGIFPVFTKASSQRMIGNLVIKSHITNHYLVGFENHSGKTFLKEGGKPLGKVTKGFGNNGEDHQEGCIYKNAIGCYMHGSLLPKNSELADWLIQKALEVKYGEEVELEPLDDSLEQKTHNFAVNKFS